MRAWTLRAIALVAMITLVALGHAQTLTQPGSQTVLVETRSAYGSEVRGIVPGDELGWEIDEVGVLLSLGADSYVELQIYSPGFDPDDYRSGSGGRAGLGDERYDGGAGTLEGSFVLERDELVLAEGMYAVEPHRWVTFFEGDLDAGAYLLRTRFHGKGKNAFVTRVVTSDPGVASLSFHEGISLFDVRSEEWTVHAEIDVAAELLPARYSLYDGDGPSELEARLELPDGRTRPLPVSGDLEWITWVIDDPGLYRVAFRLADSAAQVSNTVALREVFPAPVTAEVVRADGTPLALEATVDGYAQRRVTLDIPPTLQLVRVETDDGTMAGTDDATEVRFGFAGGSVRYVVTDTPARLRVEAVVEMPDGPRPYALRFEIDGAPQRLPSAGMAELELAAGSVALAPRVAGAQIDGPERVELRAGELSVARFVVRPEVRLRLDVEPHERIVGERFVFTAVADTDFPDLLPGDLVLALPDALRALSQPRLVAPLSSERVLRLEVEAEALEPGRHDVRARLLPWSLDAFDADSVVAPARIRLDKVATTPEVEVGGTARWQITVANDGGSPAADVHVTDPLAAGLEGTPLDATLALEPGEARVFDVAARVTDRAPERIQNRARVRYGDTLLEAEAGVAVLRPRATLERGLDRPVVVPGELVTVTLRVGNAGGANLTYRLEDVAPEWIEPLEPSSFEGTLLPGASIEHRYTGRVRFGPAARATFDATLTWSGVSLVAPDAIERVMVGLGKTVDVPRIVAGDAVAFTVRVANPLPRALTLALRESPDAGLGFDGPDEVLLDLAAGEVRELTFPARPDRVGTLRIEVSAWVDGVPVALPTGVDVEVVPPLVAERRSTVTLPFSLSLPTYVDELLIRHEVPAGAAYVAGSSRLDGAPIADPQTLDVPDGSATRLYWRIDPGSEGVLSYDLRHADALDRLAEPALAARLEDREVPLQGELTFAELEAAASPEPGEREGVIREPLPGTIFRTVDQIHVTVEAPLDATVAVRLNGQALPEEQLGEVTTDFGRGVQRLAWFGLPLTPGANLIEADVDGVVDRVEVQLAGAPERLELRPVATAADGLHPVELEIVALDARGVSNGFGAVTVATDLEPTEADAFPDRSGYQVLMRDGRALLRLRPVASPRGARVRASFNQLDLDATLYLGGAQQPLWQIQGSVTARFAHGNVSFDGLARGYLEAPLGSGTVQAALDTAGGIAPTVEPTLRFPTTGAGVDAEPALRSDDLVAVRYDDAHFTVGYWAAPIDVPGLPGLADATALRAETRVAAGSGVLAVKAFGAVLPSNVLDLDIVPNGTRRYRLDAAIRPGSERITVIVGADERSLVRGLDYALDANGVLTLAEPLWPVEDGLDVRIRVRADRAEAVRDRLGYGGGVAYRSGDWHLSVGAAMLDRLQVGAELGYRAPGTSFGVRWRMEDGRSQVGMDAAVRTGILEATLDLSADVGDELALNGRARVAAEVAPGHTVALEHRAAPERDRTDALYEVGIGEVDLGVGLGYGWQRGDASAIARVGWSRDAFGVQLTHAQGLTGELASTSDLEAYLNIDANLTARARLEYGWSDRVTGSVALEQKLGGANLALSYDLPSADGRGNRARFGVDAPLPLGSGFELDLAADLEHGFETGESAARGSFGVRYQTEALSAALGTDLVWDEQNEQPFRVVVRAGARGQIDAMQTLAFDASVQILPQSEGTFTVSYALRADALSVLTYHSLSTGGEAVLEGEAALTVHPNAGWQLRPQAAYRLYLADASRNLYQVSLGAHAYPFAGVGVGGAVHHLVQPGTGASRTAASLEGSVRIVDPVWVVLGTTFAGFDGLTADTRGGVYVRIDAFAGGR